MGLEQRVERLERSLVDADDCSYDLTRLTDDELLELHALQTRYSETGEQVEATPELEAALERASQ